MRPGVTARNRCPRQRPTPKITLSDFPGGGCLMGEMHDQSDAQLLRAYAQRGAEAAFAEIVARHADLVSSAALRQVSSPDLVRFPGEEDSLRDCGLRSGVQRSRDSAPTSPGRDNWKLSRHFVAGGSSPDKPSRRDGGIREAHPSSRFDADSFWPGPDTSGLANFHRRFAAKSSLRRSRRSRRSQLLPLHIHVKRAQLVWRNDRSRTRHQVTALRGFGKIDHQFRPG